MMLSRTQPLNRALMLGASVAAALALAACGEKAPEGQVVATVNGEEITLPELNAEAQAANIPENADKKAIMPQLLQRVIERKLFAKAAQDQGLDKTADYLVQKRRTEEALLAQLVAKQQIATVQIPNPAEIDKYVAANPTLFGARERLALDQIRFARPVDTAQLKQLEPTKSLDEVAAVLASLKIPFQRGAAPLDTAAVPPELMKRINALPAGEPFVVPAGNMIVVSVVRGREAAATPDADSKRLAAERMRQETIAKTMQDRLNQLKTEAKIDYQPGYAPATPGDAKPAGSPAAAEKPAG